MIKKNITINFCGSLYNIDEDAYELLQHYTDTIRRYFSKKEGSEEVADDIETRIAELFDELIANGANAINIEMTQDVIKRIGELSDIAPDGEGAESQSEDEPEPVGVKKSMKSAWSTICSSKRYYRDMGNKLICGVMAGFAQFLGGSPLVWRLSLIAICVIAYILSEIFNFHVAPFNTFVFLGYFIFAIITPKAEAPEDVLQMKGKKVTPQNIAEEVSNQQAKRGSIFGDIMSGIFKIILCMFSLLVVFGLVMTLGGLGTFVLQPIDKFFEFTNICGRDQEIYYAIRIPLFFCIGAVVVILSVLAYCCFHALSSSFGKTLSMSFRQRLAWFVAFVASLAVFAGGAFMCVTEVNNAKPDYYNEYVKGGWISYSKVDLDYYSKQDFRVTKFLNYTPSYKTYRGDYYTGDSLMRYMDAFSSGRNLVFQTERRCSNVSGSYELGAVCRASEGSNGACIYLQVLGKDGNELIRHIEAIPAHGNIGNNILQKGEKYALPADWNIVPDSTLNMGKGYGWSYVEIKDVFVPEGSTIVYGLTTDPDFTGQPSNVQWVSACDFRLTCTEKPQAIDSK